MRAAKLTILDEVWCTITGLEQEHIDFLWNKFGIYVDGYRYMTLYQMRRWDGKTRFFDKTTGKIYLSLFVETVIPFLETWKYQLSIEDRRVVWDAPTPEDVVLSAERILEYSTKHGEFPIAIRDYQLECSMKLVENSNGFIIAATGAGKSLICANLCDTYGHKGYRTITVVPSSDLVSQTYEWYVKCGLDAGMYSGLSKDMSHRHIVATWQSLQNKPDLIKDFEMFLIDESHGAKGAVIQKLISDYGAKIPFRFGVTGTFPKPEIDQIILRGSIGNIHHTVSARFLIDNGFLSDIEIETIQTVEPVDEEFPDYASERAFITKSSDRMEFIADLVIDRCHKHGNTLVLVNSVQFGQKLADMIEGAVFLSGATDNETRKLNYDLFDEKDDLIVIATSGIASTGISIDRVFALILVDPGKSFIKSIQSVGRGLRKAKGKTKIFVTDVSAYLKWAKKHLKERCKYYTEAGYPFNKKPIRVKI